MGTEKKCDNQITANVGLYFVCYKLSKLGWNVLPTSRNTKGVDLVIFKFNGNNTITKTLQIKTLSKKNPVPLGNKLDNLFAYWFIICQGVSIDKEPKCFILQKKEIEKLKDTREKNGEKSYWLQPRDYDKKEFEEKWDRINDIIIKDKE